MCKGQQRLQDVNSALLSELKLALSQVVLNFEPGETMEPELDYDEYLGLSEPKGPVHITLREAS
jgi:hypothetical protein